MQASLQYLMMAAYFSEDTVNLPNVAEMFFESADEERAHAIAFVTYLRMRGATDNDFFGAHPLKPKYSAFKWPGGVAEAGQDDPHAADWLTGTWLEEQLSGQRK